MKIQRPTTYPADSISRSLAARSSWRWCLLLAVTALACGLFLSGLSVWFLGSVAIVGLSASALTFNFHMPAALIRLFALGRTAAKYGERLAGHRAALDDQVNRRIGLFDAMAKAPGVRAAGWQFGDQERLADYIDDVEDIDYGRLRVDIPAVTLAFGVVGTTTATVMIMPLASLPVIALVAATSVAAVRLSTVATVTTEAVRRLKREGAQKLGATLAAVVPLRSENVWDGEVLTALDRFDAAERQLLTQRRAQALFDTLTMLLGPVTAICVIAAALIAGRCAEALLLPAFVAFAWLALGETMQTGSRLIVAAVRRRTARAEIARWTAIVEPRSLATVTGIARASNLAFYGLQRHTPDGRPIGRPLTALFEAGRPTVLIGASGCGKTSLLKQMAGWIGNDTMTIDQYVVTSDLRRDLCAFCPHDAAILADTARANLFAPSASDEALWQALTAMELDGRIQDAGGLDGWITQEALSLGEAQRLNLARAWLSGKPVVLLDEPTEHLDPLQAARLLSRLLGHLGDRVVVLSSHRPVAVPDIVRIGL